MDQPVLATDLDGTFIPLENATDNEQALVQLEQLRSQCEFTLVYVTGRHAASVQDVIKARQLPAPDWLICDVGTTISTTSNDITFKALPQYQEHLDSLIAEMPRASLRELVTPIDGLVEQEDEKQGPFKLSFYADANRLPDLVMRIQDSLNEKDAPYRIIDSVDPFNGDGLIDLLPTGVSKASALAWWIEHLSLDHDRVVFAGDSGNDRAVFESGIRSIIVANADRSLAASILDVHQVKGWEDRLFLATKTATSGVLEGYQHFRGENISR
ncbi:HAD-IIB family hydrolase [Calycomorphotria hydatis]|uniref:Mannosylfructose-phosphate phosphatase n=1 Tax=Calycomorphotria hydatis TaxID=2528027 RepID=A0A517TAU1_9PLAN|nr:HAD-IIB family hydrolase [Calycomorphotria hydatis]QDT65487.1 Mannosylfructose-phosphate phosphatase [Calycomorphotria hydatis]